MTRTIFSYFWHPLTPMSHFLVQYCKYSHMSLGFKENVLINMCVGLIFRSGGGGGGVGLYASTYGKKDSVLTSQNNWYPLLLQGHVVIFGRPLKSDFHLSLEQYSYIEKSVDVIASDLYDVEKSRDVIWQILIQFRNKLHNFYL